MESLVPPTCMPANLHGLPSDETAQCGDPISKLVWRSGAILLIASMHATTYLPTYITLCRCPSTYGVRSAAGQKLMARRRGVSDGSRQRKPSNGNGTPERGHIQPQADRPFPQCWDPFNCQRHTPQTAYQQLSSGWLALDHMCFPRPRERRPDTDDLPAVLTVVGPQASLACPVAWFTAGRCDICHPVPIQSYPATRGADVCRSLALLTGTRANLTTAAGLGSWKSARRKNDALADPSQCNIWG